MRTTNFVQKTLSLPPQLLSEQMDYAKLKGHVALWVANIIWGVNAPVCKGVLQSSANPEGINPFALSACRMAGAALLFWVASLFMPRERVSKRDLGLLLLASVFGIQFNQLLYLWGLSLTSPIDASIISTLVPILTLVLATFFLREPMSVLKVGGVALGCLGAVVLVVLSQTTAGGQSSLVGNTLCIISAISFAFYLTAFRSIIVRYRPVTVMKWMFLFAAVVALVIYHKPLMATDFAALPSRVVTGALYVIVGSTFLCYLCVPIGQQHLRPTVVSMYNYVQPVVAVLVSVTLGMDRFTPLKAAAAVCVFVGVWMVTKSKSRARLDAEHDLKRNAS